MPNIIDHLNWRYATKKFDPEKRVSSETLSRIVEAVRLAPTSSGLQPFELFVVSNPEVRARIRAVAWDQAQITDCSHLLVFAAWDDITAERVNMMFDLTNDVRSFKNAGWESYRQKLLGIITEQQAETNHNAAARQAYIGLGIAVTAAAFEKVDSTPMEGFDPAAVDGILELPSKSLRSVVMLPIGYRATEGDRLVNLKKVRRSRDDFVTDIL